MLLIYTEHTSARLQYVCKFIFGEILQATYNLTLHPESFSGHDGPKINYSNKAFDTDAYHIKPHGLLSETGIRQQEVFCAGEADDKIIFSTEGADHSFDIFSAVFYLLSRYEEYLPHTEDEYSRYAHTNSIAFKNEFLNKPLVNIWISDLKKRAEAFFRSSRTFIAEETETFSFQPSTFNFRPTYDIDIAWSYKEKGLFRTAAGFLRNPSLGRIAALLGIREDPFDSYHFLDQLHADHGLKPVYFFLVAQNTGPYDKNISPSNEPMRQLINRHGQKYEIGLHPSWKSNERPALLIEEKKLLEKISGKAIGVSRQHYIKLALPQTYRNLIDAGITDDYSMGYGSINGFRASVASSFFWYDLAAEKVTPLRIHPFCFMDANCFYEQHLTPQQSATELMEYYLECKKVNAVLITIFHNNFMGTDKTFAGWRQLYTDFISQLP